MPTKRYKPEQIVGLLRQIEVEMANGKTTPQDWKEATCDGAKRLKAVPKSPALGCFLVGRDSDKPTRHWPHFVAGPTRLELATSCVTG